MPNSILAKVKKKLKEAEKDSQKEQLKTLSKIRHISNLKTKQDSIPNYEGKAIDDLFGPYLDTKEALKGNMIFRYRNGKILGDKNE